MGWSRRLYTSIADSSPNDTLAQGKESEDASDVALVWLGLTEVIDIVFYVWGGKRKIWEAE